MEADFVQMRKGEPMKDPIERQAAIDALLEEVRLVDGYYVENDEVINKDDAIEAIRLLPSAQPEPINPCTICQEFDCTGCKFRMA